MYIQLLAEAMERSNLASKEAAEAQQEEVSVFPHANFAPLIPCSKVSQQSPPG